MTTAQVLYNSVEGKGLKFNTAEDVQGIVDEINAIQGLTEVRLSGNTFGVEAARAVAEALKSQDLLQIVGFADMFTGRLKDEIPLALEAFVDAFVDKKHLIELDLSDNAFGPRAKPLMRLLIENRNIQVLKLNNNGLGIEGGRLIASALIEAAEKNKQENRKSSLRYIVMGRNRLESPGVGHLAKAFEAHGESLKVLRMPQNSIRPDGIVTLMESLSKCPHLEHLDLQDNTFTALGSQAMAKALPTWPQLQVLNIGDCLLDPVGGIAVIKALTSNHDELVTLNLQFNEINEKGAKLVPEMLQNKKNLTSLELNGNNFEPESTTVDAIRDMLRSHDHEDALGELDEMEIESDVEDDEGEEVDTEEKEDQGVDELAGAVSGLSV